jgi:outer membrane protein assembly factor BamB
VRRGWPPAVLAACALLAPALPANAGAQGAPATSSWTGYHGDPAGDGVAIGIASVAPGAPAWSSPALDGQLYGEPLVWNGRVFVATENDTVYALSAATGAVAWSTHLGTAVPSSMLPCGDISPTVGVTGTPVIDVARGELFVVADELVNRSVTHEFVGLNAATGSTELTEDVDPPGSTHSALLQRTGLALDGGRVVFGFGGNYGDCGSYHGWVVSVPETGGTATDFQVDSGSGESQGAVWMGGAAPAVDTKGDVWVTAGNGSVHSADQAYDDSDSVLELSPALALLQYFAPSTWASDNASDLDMSTAPALLGDGQVVAAGKSGIVYLLDGAALGGIGHQEASLPHACPEPIDGGFAVVGTTVYLPCLGGVSAVTVATGPASLRLDWSSGAGGGPPIVAAGLVWTVGQNGTLYGLDPTTGAVRARAAVGAPANHFPTPSVGAGVLLVPASDRVVAFGAPVATTPTSTTSTTTSTTPPRGATSTTHAVAEPTHPPSPPGSDTGAIVAAIVGGLALLAAGSALGLRARRRRRLVQ